LGWESCALLQSGDELQLDMVTDRCSGIGIGLMLCHIFIWIEVFSHWAHMLAELKTGNKCHKNIEDGLLGFNYKTGWFMVLLIFGAESFPCMLYARGFELLDWITWLLEIVAFPLFLFKHYMNVVQFVRAPVNLDLLHKDE
jgi:CDP-diacylglycerol--inositol 3-phosphatidyltransferase